MTGTLRIRAGARALRGLRSGPLRPLCRRLQRVRARGSEESGVVLVLVAVIMTALLGMAALAIDLGSYWQAQRQAQAAADAGALAASQDLPSSTSAAKSDGTTYATTNFPGATVSVTAPYNSTTNQAKVTVTITSQGILGGIFGKSSQQITASAVAAAGTSGGSGYAIFAKDTSCDNNSTLYITDSNLTVHGGVHTNGAIHMAGSNDSFDSTTYGGPNGCSYQDDEAGHGNNKFSSAGATAPTVDSSTEPWPEDYSSYFSKLPLNPSNDPACTIYGTDLNLQNENNATLANGVYCYQTIEFNSSGLKCTCTFVASSSMQFNQGPDSFTPDAADLAKGGVPSSLQDLGFYDMDTNNVNVNANGFDFLNGGTIFVPNSSLLTINAPSGTVSSFIEGQNITINSGGSSATWTGSGPSVGGASAPPALVQ
jgi:Flp pilus assembly protein TadG